MSCCLAITIGVVVGLALVAAITVLTVVDDIDTLVSF